MATNRRFREINALAKMLSHPDFGRDSTKDSLNRKYRDLLNDLQISDFELLLNALIKNPSVNYAARAEILRVAERRLQFQQHPIIENFMYDVLEKDSFGVDLRKIKEMQIPLRQNPNTIHQNILNKIRPSNVLMEYLVEPFVTHLDTTHSAIESAETVSKLDIYRFHKIIHVCTDDRPTQDLYKSSLINTDAQDTSQAVFQKTANNDFQQALVTANISPTIQKYLLFYTNQANLLMTSMYPYYFFNIGFLPNYFSQAVEAQTNPLNRDKIAITSRKSGSVILEVYYSTPLKNMSLHGKYTVEILETKPDGDRFSNIDVTPREFSLYMTEADKRHTAKLLIKDFSGIVEIESREIKEKILGQLLLPYSKIKDRQVSIDVDAISDMNLLFLLYLKRPEWLTDEQRQALADKIAEPYFNWVLNNGSVLSERSKELVNYYIDRGKRHNQIKGNKHPTEGLANKVVTRTSPSTHIRPEYKRDGELDSVDILFQAFFNPPDEIDQQALEDFLLPLTRVKNGKADYSVPPLKAFPNDVKARILALYGIAGRANRGDPQAKIYLRKHLRVEDGDYTDPEDLIFAMLRRGLISVRDCVDLAASAKTPKEKTSWINKVTEFAIAHENYSKLHYEIDSIAKDNISKYNDVRTHLEAVSKPELGNRILNSIKDFFARVTGIVYETERYKKLHQRANAKQLLPKEKKNVEPAAPVANPPSAAKSAADVVRRLSAAAEDADNLHPANAAQPALSDTLHQPVSAAASDIVLSPATTGAASAVSVPPLYTNSTSSNNTILTDAEDDPDAAQRASPASTERDPSSQTGSGVTSPNVSPRVGV